MAAWTAARGGEEPPGCAEVGGAAVDSVKGCGAPKDEGGEAAANAEGSDCAA